LSVIDHCVILNYLCISCSSTGQRPYILWCSM